jgi:hypothetical protein
MGSWGIAIANKTSSARSSSLAKYGLGKRVNRSNLFGFVRHARGATSVRFTLLLVRKLHHSWIYLFGRLPSSLLPHDSFRRVYRLLVHLSNHGVRVGGRVSPPALLHAPKRRFERSLVFDWLGDVAEERYFAHSARRRPTPR